MCDHRILAQRNINLHWFGTALSNFFVNFKPALTTRRNWRRSCNPNFTAQKEDSFNGRLAPCTRRQPLATTECALKLNSSVDPCHRGSHDEPNGITRRAAGIDSHHYFQGFQELWISANVPRPPEYDLSLIADSGLLADNQGHQLSLRGMRHQPLCHAAF